MGVHICTGPVHVRRAEPSDVLDIRILDVTPRPAAMPQYAGRAGAYFVAAYFVAA